MKGSCPDSLFCDAGTCHGRLALGGACQPGECQRDLYCSSVAGGEGGMLGQGGSATAGGAGFGGGSSGGASNSAGGSDNATPCQTDQQCGPNAHCSGGEGAFVCVPNSEACLSDSECPTDSYCDGFCRPGPSLGAPCTLFGRCGRDEGGALLNCESGVCMVPSQPVLCRNALDCPSGQVCSNGCRPPILIGGACLGQSANDSDCAQGLACKTYSAPNQPAGATCQAPVGCFPAGVPGASRAGMAPCSDGNYCDQAFNNGQCQSDLAAGAACGKVSTTFSPWIYDVYQACSDGFCKDQGDANHSGVCTQAPGLNEPCAVPRPASQPGDTVCLDYENGGCDRCVSGLTCVSGFCREVAAAGGDCSNRGCATGLRCASVHRGGSCAAGPPLVLEPKIATSVATVAGGACVLLASGKVQCFGNAPLGRGTHDRANRDGPADVSVLDDATAIASGDGAACALRHDGSLWCWGNSPGSAQFTIRDAPLQVDGLSSVTSLAADDFGVCATHEGEVACWGRSSGINVPTAVQGLTDAVASSTSCAIRRDALMLCWGRIGGVTLAEPAQVPFVAGAIATAGTCALLDTGKVVCVTSWPLTDPPTPLPIDGAVAISGNASGGCALLADKTLRCWGQVAADPGLSNVRAVSVYANSVCAVDEDGFLYCWGSVSPQGGPASPTKFFDYGRR